jgi:transcriptional regulator with XRE-family HTH domain
MSDVAEFDDIAALVQRVIQRSEERARHRTPTRLERFLSTNHVRPADIARESGISRQSLLWLRRGQKEPRRYTMVRLARAFSTLLSRWVGAHELFEMADDPVPLNGT